jgi:hypothetical protein
VKSTFMNLNRPMPPPTNGTPVAPPSPAGGAGILRAGAGTWLCAAWLAWTMLAGQAAFGEDREHPLVPAIRLARQSLEVLDEVRDYEATFVRREVVNGKRVNQRIQLKLREKPFSVYLKFIQPHAGREVLYVQGRNQNQLLAREGSGLTSLVGTVSLAPDSPTVMAETRHPITRIGMRNLVKLLLQRWEAQTEFGETEVRFYPDAKLGEVACEVIESSHPRPRKQFPFQMTRLYIEKESRLPIRIENYGFPSRPGERPPLLEEYTYTNVRVNVGLTDRDFDRNNPEYSF